MNPLVCMRVSLLNPPTPSRESVCDLCGSLVWVALSSPPGVDAVWCWECAGEEIRKSELAGNKTMIARPTREQLADLAAHWNKRS